MARPFLAAACFLMALTVGQVSAVGDDIVSDVCVIKGVAAFSKRVHLRCENDVIGRALVNREVPSINPKSFLAVPLTPQTESFASKVFMLGLSAKGDQKGVTVWFHSAPTIEDAGCLAKDCRELTGIELQ